MSSARENARGAREVVSAEMWECLNATWNALPERQRYAALGGPARVLLLRRGPGGDVRRAGRLHDEPRRRLAVLLLGRSVERVDMIVRLLLSRVADRLTSPGWVTVLRCAGAHDTYLRTYRGALDACRVVQFLLLDRLFPRSVFHALRQAEIVPGRAGQPAQRPDRGEGRGAAAARPGPQRAGVPAPRGAARRPAGPAAGPAGLHPRRRRGRVACSTSTPRPGWRGTAPEVS